MTIYPVIMCGGAGTRLWPVSTKKSPKQFRKLVTDKSVFQDTVLRFKGRTADGISDQPIIISNAIYKDIIEEQLAEIGVEARAILLEPMARNTAAVGAAAALYIQQIDPDGLGLLLPSDHFIGEPETFMNAVLAARDVAADGHLTTFGIKPNRPETGFGYIQSGESLGGNITRIAAFREKPDVETAQTYLESGNFFWNAGIFLFPAATMISELERHAPGVLATTRQSIATGIQNGKALTFNPDIFAQTESISIDYAVMEKTDLAAVFGPLNCDWNDIGTWSMIADVKRSAPDPAPIHINTTNCQVHSEGDTLVALVGVEDLIVVVEDGVVMVTHKDHSQDVKDVVAELQNRKLNTYL